MTVLVRTLADDVWAVLDAIANLNTYRGEILDDNGQPTDPPDDPDGRVHPYAIAHFGAGQKTSNRVCATPNQLAWTFQVWAVGGDDNRCAWAVDTIRAALTGRRVDGALIREITDPGPFQRIEGVQPSRTSCPLFFGLYVCG